MPTQAESLAAYWAANPGSMEVGMANDPLSWGITEDLYDVTGISGFNDDKSGVTTWNPATQKYEYTAVEGDDWKSFNPGTSTGSATGDSNVGWYTNSQGDRVLGKMPDGFSQYRPHDMEGDWQEGSEMYPSIDPTKVGMGMGENGYQTGITQEMIDETFIPIPGGGPGPGIPRTDDWDGDPFNQPNGGIFGDTEDWTTEDWRDVIRKNPDAWGNALGGNNFGSGGVNGVDSGYQNGPVDVPLQGYETSDNKDFYQQQFADLRGNQIRQDMNREAAQAAGQAANQDPFEFNSETAFDWYNDGQGLPEVSMGTGEAPPMEWGLREGFTPQSTNSDILRAAMGNTAFGDENMQRAQGYLDDSTPEFLNSMAWSNAGNPNAALEFSPNAGPGNLSMITAALNNAYGSSGGGPAAPIGYANPIN
jgi:hypothetical protein